MTEVPRETGGHIAATRTIAGLFRFVPIFAGPQPVVFTHGCR